MKITAKTTIEVVVTYEYDDDCRALEFGEDYVKAVAVDNVIRPYTGVEDGVRVIEVSDTNGNHWYHKSDEE